MGRYTNPTSFGLADDLMHEAVTEAFSEESREGKKNQAEASGPLTHPTQGPPSEAESLQAFHPIASSPRAQISTIPILEPQRKWKRDDTVLERHPRKPKKS